VLARRPVKAPFTLPHFVEWAKRLELDNGEPWEVEDFFAAYVEDVFAGFQQCWLVVPEGNTKTTGLAGLALYHCEFRPRAFSPWAASARDQAEIGYRQAVTFVESMPAERRPRCYDGYRRITFANGSRIQVFAAGAEHADGVIPTLPILDELHRHKGLGLYRTWAGKLRKRGGQLLAISTAGEPGSEFEETREAIKAQAIDVRTAGAFVRAATDRVVLHEWAVRDDQVEDMAAVKAANPFSKITETSLAEKRSDPAMSLSHWKRFTCNIATTVDSDPYVEGSVWQALGDGDEIPDGANITLGADGSRTWDTTVVARAHLAGDGRIDVDAMVFSVVEDHPHHVLHSGGKIDFDDVENYILDLFGRFHPLETAYDPRYLERSMEIVDRRLSSQSVFPVEPFSKNMRDALQVFYTAVAEGRIRHRGDPVIAAHLANAKVERDQRNKEIRRIGKIDPKRPIDAVPAMALAVWRIGFAKPSVYESRGVLTV
jgi:phage terminase large subunit-like protein